MFGASYRAAVPRFRIVRPLPPVVAFRNGTLHFDTRESMGGFHFGPEWRTYVRRAGGETYPLWSAPTREGLDAAAAAGFAVEAGSPQERVMLALVRLGVAEALG